jgi:Ni,Fe-hydrogenase III component G
MEQQELENRLSQIEDRLITTQRTKDTRIFLLCEAQNCFDVCRFLFEELALRFVTSSGIDSDNCFEVLHHFSNDRSGCIVTVKAFIRDREKPSIGSITPFLPAAEWIEREMHDVLGIDFIGHPNLRRLILHDGWPQGVYPLRKDAKI